MPRKLISSSALATGHFGGCGCGRRTLSPARAGLWLRAVLTCQDSSWCFLRLGASPCRRLKLCSPESKRAFPCPKPSLEPHTGFLWISTFSSCEKRTSENSQHRPFELCYSNKESNDTMLGQPEKTVTLPVPVQCGPMAELVPTLPHSGEPTNLQLLC